MKTFVLRARPTDEPGGESGDNYPVDIQGSVEHVGDGRVTPFSSGDQLLESLLTGIVEASRERVSVVD
jgi:hypothetical protein